MCECEKSLPSPRKRRKWISGCCSGKHRKHSEEGNRIFCVKVPCVRKSKFHQEFFVTLRTDSAFLDFEKLQLDFTFWTFKNFFSISRLLFGKTFWVPNDEANGPKMLQMEKEEKGVKKLVSVEFFFSRF